MSITTVQLMAIDLVITQIVNLISTISLIKEMPEEEIQELIKKIDAERSVEIDKIKARQ